MSVKSRRLGPSRRTKRPASPRAPAGSAGLSRGMPSGAARFTGASLEEAVTGVRLAYGPAAMILSTRSRRKYGLLGPVVVEVLACPGGSEAEDRDAGASWLCSAMRGRTAGTPAAGDGAARAGPAGAISGEGTPASGWGVAPSGIRAALEDLLKAAGVAPGLAIALATNAMAGGLGPLISTKHLGTALGEALTELIGRPRPVELSAGTNRVAVFIGPHGGGKTTALIKVACDLSLIGGHRVALVTADTHRLAAAEQLARYAAILGVDFAVAYTPGEVFRQCSRLGGADVTLVDTPGHVWRSPDDLSELGGILEAASPGEVHLVLPATRDLTLAEHTMYAYRPLGVDRLLVTKLDEAESYGPVVNLAAATKLPVSYLGYGCDVPGVLEVPEPLLIARALLGGKPPRALCGGPDRAREREAGAVG